MPEEYKIDYTGIQTPDIETIKRTSQQFADWRRSMGFQTEEEKNAALTAEMQAAQQRFNDQDLWNSEDPYEVYDVYETDPTKQAEFRRNGQMVAGVGSIIATLPFTAGMIGGWTPAIVSTATGAAGGHVGAYGGQKLGQYIDGKYGTNLTPGLTFAGGLVGGTIGGGLGYKGWEGVTNQHIINKAFKSGQLKWGQPTSYTAYHQSATPITKFKFPFKRWDVAKHGADPNGAFFTVGEPATAGFLAERPYTGQFQVKVQKPLIQTGELTGPTKNGLRNAIVRRARKDGADAVFFDGIADNTLQNQQILFAMDNADIGYRGMIGTPFKQGNWQLPKGQKNQPHNPTATERIYSVLGRDSDVPTGGVDLDLLEMNSASHQNLASMYEFLQKHGVDTKNITLADLENLYGMRLNAIRTASGGTYNLALPDASTALPGNWALPRQWRVMGYDKEGLVGSIDMQGVANKPGANIKMIRNHTRPENHTIYYDPRTGSEVIESFPRSQVSGVSQRMYDAAIPVAQQTNNGRGLMSGEIYLQPWRSTAVMKHYPTKKLINMSGEYHWENLDPSKATTTGPIWLLDTPSGRYKHVPTKSSLFFPSTIKDGQITTNVNHGSIFLEDGGKVNPRQ